MARSAIHPGEHLADAIAAAGITATQLARDLEVPPNRITGILHFTRGITADTALRLGRYFGISAAFWMNLQRTYDLRRAEQRSGTAWSGSPRVAPVRLADAGGQRSRRDRYGVPSGSAVPRGMRAESRSALRDEELG